MKSMTGFGKAEINTPSGKISMEISSVNGRFLEVSTKLPKQLSILESRVREIVSEQLNRGKIKIYISFEEADSSPDKYLINEAAFKSYHNHLKSLAKKYKLEKDVKIRDLLVLPDITQDSLSNINEEAVWKHMQKVLIKALTQLKKMRHQEGSALKADMTQRLTTLSKLLKEVISLSHNSVDKYREKLNQRIKELLESPAPDTLRLEEEIALFAERADVSEECIRLDSHIQQFRSDLKKNESVGKRLNFILQEMNREINTIASKSSEITISSVVISMKDEVEKMREQVQNVE